MSDIDQRIDRLDDRVEEIDRLVREVQASRQFYREKRDEYREEIDEYEQEVRVLKKVEELFKYLLDKNVHRYAESFSDVVTEGLQFVFHDQNLSFQVNVDKKHGGIWVEFETSNQQFEGQPLESFGGGVASVESLILRLLVLLKKDLARYLILDESLAALSSEYVDRMSDFISHLSEKFDVDILLVTHNREFAEHADHVYRAEQIDGRDQDTLSVKEIDV